MQEKDKTRRKVLIGLTSAIGLSGIPFAATPFIAAWNPSAKAKAAGDLGYAVTSGRLSWTARFK